MKLLFILILLTTYVFADSTDEALSKTQEAFLNLEYVKKTGDIFINEAEKIATYVSPIDIKYIKAIGPAALAIYNGEIDTQRIKNLNIKLIGAKVRPDLYYNIKNYNANTKLMFTWAF